MSKFIYIESIHRENFIEAVAMYDEEIIVIEESEELLTVCEDVCEQFESLAYDPHGSIKADKLIRVEFGF